MTTPQFTQSFIRSSKKVHAKNAILLVGLPGVGFASKLAVDHLVKHFKAQRVATIYSPHFPNQVIATANGNLRPFTLKFYFKKVNGRNVFLLRGDLQPLTVEGQYEVASKSLEYFSASGGANVYSMAGLVSAVPAQPRSVHVSATHKSELKTLTKEMHLKVNSNYVPIVGMAGLIPTLAPLYGLSGACMLVETTGEPIDAVAASRLVEIVGKMVGKKIPVTQLKKKAQEAKTRLEQMSRPTSAVANQEQSIAMPGAAPIETPRDTLSYIR